MDAESVLVMKDYLISIRLDYANDHVKFIWASMDSAGDNVLSFLNSFNIHSKS